MHLLLQQVCLHGSQAHIVDRCNFHLLSLTSSLSPPPEPSTTKLKLLQKPQPPSPSAPGPIRRVDPRPHVAAADALSQPAVASTPPTAPSTSGRVHNNTNHDSPRGRVGGRRGGRRMGTKGNLRRWTNQELWQTLCTDGPSLHIMETYPLQVLNFAIKVGEGVLCVLCVCVGGGVGYCA